MLICSLTKFLSLKTWISCFSHDLELLCLLVSLPPKYWHFHQQCVMCRVQAIHEAMSDCLNAGLIDHHSSHCIVCNPAAGPHSPDHNSFDDHDHFGFAQQVVLLQCLVSDLMQVGIVWLSVRKGMWSVKYHTSAVHSCVCWRPGVDLA